MKDTLVKCVREAGGLLLKFFGKLDGTTRKGDFNDIVTAADIASENLIFEIIRRRHPDHNLLGEESGIQDHGSEITWVVDPLDGTSNFAAGLPWFGVMGAVLRKNQPIMAAMYLPVDDVLYLSEQGQGVSRNGKPVSLATESDLRNVLCTYGMDAGVEADVLQRQTRMMSLLITRARNVRITNSLVDFCNTLDGHFGACINHNCKISDIAPACLMFPEAGGQFTDLQGKEIRLELNREKFLRSYAVVGGNTALHNQVLELAREAGL